MEETHKMNIKNISETSYDKPRVDEHYIRPKEAERKIKMAGSIKQTVWCYGVSGYGKTSFFADYLKRRRYYYYSAKTMRPEQFQIPEIWNKTIIVIIDDLFAITESDEQSDWKKIITEMIERENVWLILISRSDVPVWLHTIAVEHIFYKLGEEDLCLTREEVHRFHLSWNLSLEPETEDRIWQLGIGNPLWNRICDIMLSRLVIEPGCTRNKKAELEFATVETSRENYWKYLNVHVYDLWDTVLLESMIKLSLLGEFDLDMAIYMTGNSNINIILQQAQDLGNFLVFNNHYWKIREPMCLSMFQRLRRNFDTVYVRNLMIRAGDCFKIKGKIMKALEMYEKANDQRSIAELLIQNARENPSTGHYYEMRNYYLKLSEEYIKESVELMGCMSMLQSMLMNEEESERWYNELKQFSTQNTGSLKREAKNRLLYLDIALPHRGSKNLIEIMRNAYALIFNRKAKLPDLSVTSNLPSQMNGGKDFCEWSKRDRELSILIGKPICFVLGRYGKGLVNLALAESGLEKGEDNYEVESLAIRGRMEAESGGKIEQCFVAVGIIFWLSIITNHTENAMATIEGFREMAKKQKISQQMFRNMDAMCCRLFLYRGRTADIAEWMKEAPNENDEFYGMDRLRYLTKVRVYLSDHKYEQAGILLHKLTFYAEKMERTYIMMEIKILKAILYYRIKNDRWEKMLQEAITEAESYHFVRILSREGTALLPLLKKGNFTWSNKEFRKQVEKETVQLARYYPAYLNSATDNAEIVLSENALKILRLQALGKSGTEIADELHISPATVKYHNKTTYKKLGVKTKAQAINEARNRKLL